MPTYDVKNVETGEEKEVIMSYSSLQEYLSSGEWTQVHKKSVELVRENGDVISKSPDGWTDLLKSIKKGSGRGNTIRHK